MCAVVKEVAVLSSKDTPYDTSVRPSMFWEATYAWNYLLPMNGTRFWVEPPMFSRRTASTEQVSMSVLISTLSNSQSQNSEAFQDAFNFEKSLRDIRFQNKPAVDV